MTAVHELSEEVGAAEACRAMQVSRASYYRRRRPVANQSRERCPSQRALSELEQAEVLAVLHDDRFVDRAPAEICATLLDEGKYYCSERTMYRLLAKRSSVRERRDQMRHPVYQKPELLATGPNQVWSWDITKLRGPVKWSHFSLYVLLDIFSRFVVGWLLARSESAALARRLIEESCQREEILPGQLIVHSDRGQPMRSKTLAQLLADLQVTQSHSRPHVSDDNPFSESQFKTLKYAPSFPERFGSLEDGRSFLGPFFHWYNEEHRHSGIGMMTPGMIHRGDAPRVLAARQRTLDQAFVIHPERFVRGRPSPRGAPEAVWINRPANIAMELQGQEVEGILFGLEESEVCSLNA